jgi:tetratricopeptide (TPR) repeat protein
MLERVIILAFLWSNVVNGLTADELFEQGRYDEAVKAYEQEINEMADDLAEADEYLENAYDAFYEKKYFEALEYINKTLEILPKSGETWILKASILGGLNDYIGAGICFDKAIEYKTDDYQGWFGKGWALHKLGRDDEAVEYFYKVVELGLGEGKYVTMGSLLEASGFPGVAVTYYEKAIEEEPSPVTALMAKGVVYFELGEFDDALRCFNDVLKIRNTYGKAWDGAGRSLVELGEYDMAIDAFERAFYGKTIINNRIYEYMGDAYRAVGDNKEADKYYEVYFGDKLGKKASKWYDKGIELYDRGEIEGSIKYFNMALKLEPENTEIWKHKGWSLDYTGRHEEALVCFEKALELNPTDAELWFDRGVAFMFLEQYEEALQNFDNATGIDPEYPNAWCNKGSVLVGLGEYEEAVVCFENALETDPLSYSTYVNEATALKELGQLDRALEYSNYALDLNPLSDEAYNVKGNVLSELGEDDNALKCYDKALEINPNNTAALGNKAIVLYGMGKEDEALAVFKRAILLGLVPTEIKYYVIYGPEEKYTDIW